MRFKILVTAFMAFVMVAGFGASARAEVEKSADAGVSVMSNYVWRGLRLSDSWVVQPTVGISAGGFGANLWSNYDGNTGESNETDLTLSYSTSIEKVSLEAGYIYYALDGLSDTQEIYVSAGYDYVVSPSLTVYYDMEEGTGGYAVLALGYSRDLTDKVSLSLGASASYLFDNAVVGVDASGEEYSDLHNGEVSASLGVDLGGGLSVSPMVAYTFPLSDKAEDAIKAYSFDGEDSTFYGGLSLGMSF